MGTDESMGRLVVDENGALTLDAPSDVEERV
jgi:hypothetical protein